MNMEKYFENKRGRGVLATASSSGAVDVAVYSRPHFLEDGTLAFIMRERLTHQHLQENGHAAYMFMEEGQGYEGVRLFLTKVNEDSDPELIEKMTRRNLTPQEDKERGTKHIVYFKVEKILSLIGGEELDPNELI